MQIALYTGDNFESHSKIKTSYSGAVLPSHQFVVLVLIKQHTHARACTHTHTHTLNGPFSRTTRLGQYQKGITNLDFTKARDSEWQWHQLDASLHLYPDR